MVELLTIFINIMIPLVSVNNYTTVFSSSHCSDRRFLICYQVDGLVWKKFPKVFLITMKIFCLMSLRQIVRIWKICAGVMCFICMSLMSFIKWRQLIGFVTDICSTQWWNISPEVKHLSLLHLSTEFLSFQIVKKSQPSLWRFAFWLN